MTAPNASDIGDVWIMACIVCRGCGCAVYAIQVAMEAHVRTCEPLRASV